MPLPIPAASQWPFDWPEQHAEPERPRGKPSNPALLRVAPLGGRQRPQDSLLEAGLPTAFVQGFREGLDPFSTIDIEVEHGHDKLLLRLGRHSVAVAGVDLLVTAPWADQRSLGVDKGATLRHKVRA